MNSLKTSKKANSYDQIAKQLVNFELRTDAQGHKIYKVMDLGETEYLIYHYGMNPRFYQRLDERQFRQDFRYLFQPRILAICLILVSGLVVVFDPNIIHAKEFFRIFSNPNTQLVPFVLMLASYILLYGVWNSVKTGYAYDKLHMSQNLYEAGFYYTKLDQKLKLKKHKEISLTKLIYQYNYALYCKILLAHFFGNEKQVKHMIENNRNLLNLYHKYAVFAKYQRLLNPKNKEKFERLKYDFSLQIAELNNQLDDLIGKDLRQCERDMDKYIPIGIIDMSISEKLKYQEYQEASL